jgi:hypothetical protein
MSLHHTRQWLVGSFFFRHHQAFMDRFGSACECTSMGACHGHTIIMRHTT